MSTSAAAQNVPDLRTLQSGSIYDRGAMAIGTGSAIAPDFGGFRDATAMPLAGPMGRVTGMSLGGLALGTVRDPEAKRIAFSIGPAMHWAGGNGPARDIMVSRFGKFGGTNLQGGISGKVTVRRLLESDDAASFGVRRRWHSLSTRFDYVTPISHAQLLGFSLTGDFMSRRHLRRTFPLSQRTSVSAFGGLPGFDPRGGMKKVGAKLFTAYDLDGDVLKGQLAVVGGLSYTRRIGSSARTPATALPTRSNQWVFATGLAYSF
ncbi:MAG: MipA/OmpV family protein [Novosphingobium sp.]|nr:MipA/OmpV family protein [Novosphingobium sp.]